MEDMDQALNRMYPSHEISGGQVKLKFKIKKVETDPETWKINYILEGPEGQDVIKSARAYDPIDAIELVAEYKAILGLEPEDQEAQEPEMDLADIQEAKMIEAQEREISKLETDYTGEYRRRY